MIVIPIGLVVMIPRFHRGDRGFEPLMGRNIAAARNGSSIFADFGCCHT